MVGAAVSLLLHFRSSIILLLGIYYFVLEWTMCVSSWKCLRTVADHFEGVEVGD